MLVRILARPVDVEAVVGVLDRRDAQAAPVKFGNEPDDERRLARSAPAGEAYCAHAPEPLLPPAPFIWLSSRPAKKREERNAKRKAHDNRPARWDNSRSARLELSAAGSPHAEGASGDGPGRDADRRMHGPDGGDRRSPLRVRERA